jgi:myo-inositol 2-dehydrogenase/D-chiro-inositol 1-dehydrogenase
VRTPEAALADEAVRAVIICSSTDTHADLIQRSAAAGKQIFCEKPVDLDVVRARACAQAISRAGVTCMIGFQRRFDPTFAALKKRLVDGEIGDPEMLLVTSRDPAAPPIDYIVRSGGIFKDMLIHDFDIFRWILDDEAASIYAIGSCLTDPAIASASDVDSTAVIIRTGASVSRKRHQSPRRMAMTSASRCRARMPQAGNHRPTEVTASTGPRGHRQARAFFPSAIASPTPRDGALSTVYTASGHHGHSRRQGARARRCRDALMAERE